MSQLLPSPITAEEFYDFVNLPENQDRNFELEDGQVVESPLPGELRAFVCANTVGFLGDYVRRIKRGRVYCNNMSVVLRRGPDTVYGPDVAVYMDQKKLKEMSFKYPEKAPTAVIEVLSTHHRVGKMMRKVTQFLAHGVEVALLVDPDSRDITVFRRKVAPVVFEETEVLRELPELPGFRCRVAKLFEIQGV